MQSSPASSARSGNKHVRAIRATSSASTVRAVSFCPLGQNGLQCDTSARFRRVTIKKCRACVRADAVFVISPISFRCWPPSQLDRLTLAEARHLSAESGKRPCLGTICFQIKALARARKRRAGCSVRLFCVCMFFPGERMMTTW